MHQSRQDIYVHFFQFDIVFVTHRRLLNQSAISDLLHNDKMSFFFNLNVEYDALHD